MKSKLLNLAILILGIFLIVNLTRSIRDLIGAGDQTKIVEEQVAKEKLKNDELKKKLTEVQSPAFLEKIARDKLGLAKEGELVIILPSPKPAIDLFIKQGEITNWQKWYNLFF